MWAVLCSAASDGTTRLPLAVAKPTEGALASSPSNMWAVLCSAAADGTTRLPLAVAKPTEGALASSPSSMWAVLCSAASDGTTQPPSAAAKPPLGTAPMAHTPSPSPSSVAAPLVGAVACEIETPGVAAWATFRSCSLPEWHAARKHCCSQSSEGAGSTAISSKAANVSEQP